MARIRSFTFTTLTLIAIFTVTVLPPAQVIAAPPLQESETYEFVLKWGAQAPEGQFNTPVDLAVDNDGNVYVVDEGNCRIQKFDSNGNFITAWGQLGNRDGEFWFPQGVAVDSQSYVYVADTQNHRIQKFDSNGSFITEWGSRGSGEGQFLSPHGIALDSRGYVYVADSGNDRIQKFDANGNFIAKWGSRGSGEGQFWSPCGIALDSQGYVYVVDLGNYRIQKFDSNGNFITKWGSEGSGEGQFELPYGIALDSQGYVYVADTDNDRIQKFDSNGNFITEWGSEGSVEGQFEFPQGIALDSAGYVYVADTDNNRIQKFDSNGNFITQWRSEGSEGEFKSAFVPSDIAVDSQGYVYVADKNHRIQKFDSNGNFITKWGSEGSGEGQFRSPGGIALDSQGYVYVADSGNDRIQKFDSNGNLITQWGSGGSGEGQFKEPNDVAVDSQGYIYVADSGNDRIQKFDSNGNFITKWGSRGSGEGQFGLPFGIVLDSQGYVYIADSGNCRIQKFDSNGSFITEWGSRGSGEGQFWFPQGIALDSQGYIYVVEPGNDRIQKFAKSGVPIPVPTTPTPTFIPTPKPLPSPTPSITPIVPLETLAEKQANIDFLSNPSFDFLGLELPPLDVPTLGYDERGAQQLLDNVKAKSERGELSPEEASGFLRLKLQEDATKEIYLAYSQTADDVSDNVVSVVAVSFSFINTIERIADSLADQPVVGDLIRRLLIQARRKAYDVISDFVQLAVNLMPEGRLRNAVESGGEAIVTYLKAKATGKDAILEVILKGSARFVGDQELITALIATTQPALDEGVRRAQPENVGSTVKGTDERAQLQVAWLIEDVGIETDLAHTIHEDMKRGADLVKTISDLADLATLVTGPTGVGPVIAQGFSILSKFVGNVVLLVSTGNSATHLYHLPPRVYEAGDRAFDPTMPIGSYELPTSEVRRTISLSVPSEPTPGIVYAAELDPRQSYLDAQRAHLQISADDYEAALQEVLKAVQDGDREALMELIPDLIAAEESLSAQFKVSRAPILAGAAQIDEPGFGESFAQVFSGSSDFNLNTAMLYAYLIDNLLEPKDAEAKRRTVEQANIVLGSINEYRETIETTLPELASIPSPPTIIISSYTLPDRIEEGATFALEIRASIELRANKGTLGTSKTREFDWECSVINTKVNNTSPTLADRVTVELTGGDLISPSSKTISLGQMGSGEEKATTFKLKATESGFDVVTLRVISGEEVLSSQMVYLDIDPSTGGFNTRTLIFGLGGAGFIVIVLAALIIVASKRR